MRHIFREHGDFEHDRCATDLLGGVPQDVRKPRERHGPAHEGRAAPVLRLDVHGEPAFPAEPLYDSGPFLRARHCILWKFREIAPVFYAMRER